MFLTLHTFYVLDLIFINFVRFYKEEFLHFGLKYLGFVSVVVDVIKSDIKANHFLDVYYLYRVLATLDYWRFLRIFSFVSITCWTDFNWTDSVDNKKWSLWHLPWLIQSSFNLNNLQQFLLVVILISPKKALCISLTFSNIYKKCVFFSSNF